MCPVLDSFIHVLGEFVEPHSILKTFQTKIPIRGADGHFDFFSPALSSTAQSKAGNPEYFAEKKAADDKWEAMITMSLGGRTKTEPDPLGFRL